jgi:hypothetical protein
LTLELISLGEGFYNLFMHFNSQTNINNAFANSIVKLLMPLNEQGECLIKKSNSKKTVHSCKDIVYLVKIQRTTILTECRHQKPEINITFTLH